MKKLVYLIVALSTLFLNKIHAQDAPISKPPAAILVQLRAERNKLNALKPATQAEQIAQVKQDRDGVIKALTNDFTDHFTFCKVYYFMDTNLEVVLKRDFSNVLLNADLSPAGNITTLTDTASYLIIYYGSPVQQRKSERIVTDSLAYMNAKGQQPIGKGLVINNYRFQQLAYFYKFGYDEVGMKHKWGKKYWYTSKKFEMEYFPFAKRLDNALIKNSGRIKISR